MNALPDDFTHLHVHSHYSLLGGIASPAALVAQARAAGMRSLALADSNALFGAVAFARACRAEGIRPIIGMTASLEAPPEDMPPDHNSALGRLVLLATGPDGYRSLCRLASLYQTDPDREHRGRKGFQWEELRDHTRGLVCLTGGRADWLERYLRAGQIGAAGRYVARLGGLFGENCCLALSPDLMAAALRPLADEILDLARRFGLRTVAAQPIFCLQPSERSLLRLMAAIDANCTVTDVDPGMLPDCGDSTSAVEWPASGYFAECFGGHPGLLDAAAEVSSLCGEALPDGRPIWPALDIDFPDVEMARQAEAGMNACYGDPAPPGVAERLARETAVIAESGFAPLFLVVADLVRFARESGVPVSTRGSVANSLAAYCLGITTVDPVVHDLLFERFLNPSRRNPPDIDLDLCSRRRNEVLDYVRRRYGADRVALVCTINTMQPRSAVRETGKARGLPGEAIDALVAALPQGWHPDPRRRSTETIEDVIANIAEPLHRDVLREAYRLVGQPHHAGLHPGGMVITPGPLTDTVPVLLSPKGYLATQFEHSDVEAIGLPKLDLLGIRALTVLADAVELVQANHEAEFRIENIPAEDPATAAILSAGETIGVFQCESDGARRTLRQLRAAGVADLAVAGAFFKPGPATGGMARAFIRRYRGEESVTYLHPALEPILGRTKGVLIFQEQVLRLAVEIAGLDWSQADLLRRGMSKFKAGEIDALATEFIDGCCRPAPAGPAFSREQAAKLWDQIVPFAGYGFNQGHATAYADIAYRSAYIKAHWPAEFLWARLAGSGGFHHPAIYEAEAARLGIAVRPPHINFSRENYTLTYRAGEPDGTSIIWMGLGQVRDLRRASVEAIIAGRATASYAGLADLTLRVALSRKELAHLVRCGAFDGLGPSRAAMLQAAGVGGRSAGAGQLSFGFLDAPEVPAESPAERVAWETEILGRPVSTHPLQLVPSLPGEVALRRLPLEQGKVATVRVVRIPGWPGGAGFFMSDGDTFTIARPDKALAAEKVRWPTWRPMRLSGRWLRDEWGGGWFQIEKYEMV